MKQARSSGTTHAVAMFESSIYVSIRNKLSNVVVRQPFTTTVWKIPIELYRYKCSIYFIPYSGVCNIYEMWENVDVK